MSRVQEACLDVLYFLDGQAEQRRRTDLILASAVASGTITAVQAWPEYFPEADEGDRSAFPSTDADMSAFRLEEATPESFAADMAALVAASQTVVIHEPAPRLPVTPEHEYVPSLEWT